MPLGVIITAALIASGVILIFVGTNKFERFVNMRRRK